MPELLTFQAFVERWLRDFASVAYKPSTTKEYESVLRSHLLPRFGDDRLESIRPQDVQSHIASVDSEGLLSAASIRNQVTVLRSLFSVAVDWGLLEQNPAVHVISPRAERAEMSFLTPGQMQTLIELTPSKWRMLIAAACLTGLRKGELLALQWEDVDTGSSALRVRHTLFEGQLQAPKSPSSIRAVPIPSRLNAMLLSVQSPSSTGFVFNEQGWPLSSRMPNKVLRYALKRAQLPEVRFHDLRHSFVAAHVAAGTPPKVIQGLLGHASIQTTLDTYGHLMPELNQASAAALESAVFGSEG